MDGGRGAVLGRATLGGDGGPTSLAGFIRIAGVGALVGGGLRVLAAFMPWRRESVPHEALALMIDIGLMLGLAALFIASGARLGRVGRTGLLLAFIGVASIVGPDSIAFGLDFYAVGVGTVGLGIAVVGVAGLRAGLAPHWAYATWFAVPLLSLAGNLVGRGDAGFVAAGVAFGMGFVGTGRALSGLGARGVATAFAATLATGAFFFSLVSLAASPAGTPLALADTRAKEARSMELNQVTLPALDLDRSVDFYRRFGLRLIVYSPENQYARFEIPGGNSTLSVHVEPRFAGGPSAQVFFESTDPEALVAALAGRGIHPVEPLQRQPWLWTEVWFTDPAGNRVAIYSAGDNRKNPPWRLPDDPA